MKPVAASPPVGTIAELDYFVGAWRAEARDPSTGKTFELVYRVEPVLRGAWYQGTGTATALDLEIRDLWGKDRETGELVRAIFDSQRTFGTVRSTGWAGDTLIFQGEAVAGGSRVTVRETIVRVGPDEFHALWESRDGQVWTAYSDERLRRIR
jgi:hypothetical protein